MNAHSLYKAGSSAKLSLYNVLQVSCIKWIHNISWNSKHLGSVIFTLLVTYCDGLQEEEPWAAHPMPLIWASHKATSELMGQWNLPNRTCSYGIHWTFIALFETLNLGLTWEVYPPPPPSPFPLHTSDAFETEESWVVPVLDFSETPLIGQSTGYSI